MQSPSLINIHKVRILLVRHVHKRRGIQLASDELSSLLHLCSQLLFLLVLPDKGISEDEEERELNAVGNKERANAQVV